MPANDMPRPALTTSCGIAPAPALDAANVAAHMDAYLADHGVDPYDVGGCVDYARDCVTGWCQEREPAPVCNRVCDYDLEATCQFGEYAVLF